MYCKKTFYSVVNNHISPHPTIYILTEQLVKNAEKGLRYCRWLESLGFSRVLNLSECGFQTLWEKAFKRVGGGRGGDNPMSSTIFLNFHLYRKRFRINWSIRIFILLLNYNLSKSYVLDYSDMQNIIRVEKI